MKIDRGLMTGSTTLLILKLLSEGEKYGYEMIRELARRSQNAFELKEGTLYPILHDLEDKGCVEAFTQETSGGRQRRYYRITQKGMGLLRDKTEEWRYFAGKVNGVLGGATVAPGLA